MDGLARIYADVLSDRMIDVTHAENGAWATVWCDGRGSDQPIDYRLALAENDPNRDAILEANRDREAMTRAAMVRAENIQPTV